MATQRELANKVGVSTGDIHYVLNALVEKGMLNLSNFTAAEDKRRYAYVLTPKGITAKAEIDEARGDLSEQELAEIHAELKTGN